MVNFVAYIETITYFDFEAIHVPVDTEKCDDPAPRPPEIAGIIRASARGERKASMGSDPFEGEQN